MMIKGVASAAWRLNCLVYGLFLSYQSGDILKAKVSFLFACMAEYAFSGKWQVGCGVWCGV
ncbi:hypothetical protein, partial [Microcystis aeruginosa]|uniref:hypothetical protein n=1 Tax=Microcystis aeruginosa TaxID=1126 RepID=UPI00232C42CA